MINVIFVSVRMDKAAEFLRFSHYDVQTISAKVGYANVTSFNRAFKSYFGVNPNQLRDGKMRGDVK